MSLEQRIPFGTAGAMAIIKNSELCDAVRKISTLLRLDHPSVGPKCDRNPKSLFRFDRQTRRSLELLLISLPPLAALVILTVAISAPVVQAIFGYPFGELGYHLLFSVCHQYPLRSFWILDHPMAVCARCTGGYSGVALGIIVVVSKHNYNRHQYDFLVLGGSLFALGVGDAILKTLTGIDGTNAWRLSTGLVGGMGFSFLTRSLVFATAQAVEGVNLRFGRQK